MTPLQFITEAGGQYNDPVGDVLAALQKPVVIHSESKDWEILSYYYDEAQRQMVMDIAPKETQS